MPLFEPKKVEPQVFENEDYRMEYRTQSPDSRGFSYTVRNKKDNTLTGLNICVDEECYNIDGHCRLVLAQKGKDPIYLTALRPSAARRRGDTVYIPAYKAQEEIQKYKNEMPIGGHRELNPEDHRWHYTKNLDDVMAIYRALTKGDFKVDAQRYYEATKGKKPSYSQEQGSKEVLKFMDSYIFNTDESREVLAEFMNKHPIYPKQEKKEQKEIDSKLALLRKKVIKNADEILGTNLEKKKLPNSLKKIEKAVSDKLFGKVKE